MRDIIKLTLIVYEGSEPLYETTLAPPIRIPARIGNPIRNTKPKSKGVVHRIVTQAFRLLFPPEDENKKKALHIALNILLQDSHNICPSWRPRCFQAIQLVSKDLGIYINRDELTSLVSSQASWWDESRISTEELHRVYSLLVDVLEYPPIRSLLHIEGTQDATEIELKTYYSQYQVEAAHDNGEIIYQSHQNRATSPLVSQGIAPSCKQGVMEQSRWISSTSPRQFFTYSGPIETSFHLLEEVLHIKEIQNNPVFLRKQDCAPTQWIMITSFYTWKEFEWISQQKQAIQALDGQYLVTPDQSCRLRFLYTNLPLHTTWAPREIHAVLQDLNLESYIWLTLWTYQKLELPTHILQEWTDVLSRNYSDFFQHETARLHILDHFKESIPGITRLLQTRTEPMAQGLQLLLLDLRQDGAALRDHDRLILLSLMSQSLSLPHHKNSDHRLVDLAYAKALDKAQHVYTQWNQHPFLPGLSPKAEAQFLSLYRLYLEWEESMMCPIHEGAIV